MASVFLRYCEVFRYFESFYLVKWPKNLKFYSSNARVYAISGFAIAGVHCTQFTKIKTLLSIDTACIIWSILKLSYTSWCPRPYQCNGNPYLTWFVYLASDAGTSSISIPGRPLSVSAAYTGRVAIAYQTGQAFQRRSSGLTTKQHFSIPVCFLWEKSIICLEGKSMTPQIWGYCYLSFLPATPLSQS